MDISSYKVNSKEFLIGSSPTILNELNYLKYFIDNKVSLIVKICKENLYNKQLFIENKIDIIENIQNDGLYPDDNNIKILDNIYENYIKNNKKIFFHCKAGIGRAPTFLGYIVIKYLNKNSNDFITEIRKIRENSINSVQLKWLFDLNSNSKKNICIIL